MAESRRDALRRNEELAASAGERRYDCIAMTEKLQSWTNGPRTSRPMCPGYGSSNLYCSQDATAGPPIRADLSNNRMQSFARIGLLKR
jgi:hypothetical protein